jgi:ATP-dependent DNA ligase
VSAVKAVTPRTDLYAFDLLELDGNDLRGLPLGDRKKRLARLLSGRRLGIVLSDPTDEDGATIFRHACGMGLEGIVSKRLTAPYRSGSSRDWLKVKNPVSPAMIRAGKWSGDAGTGKKKAPVETTGALAARGSRLKITKGSAGNDSSRPP